MSPQFFFSFSSSSPSHTTILSASRAPRLPGLFVVQSEHDPRRVLSRPFYNLVFFLSLPHYIALPQRHVSHLRWHTISHAALRTPSCPLSPLHHPYCNSYPFFFIHPVNTSYPSMAETPAHRLDLRVGGKYRLGKKIGSGSFGT